MRQAIGSTWVLQLVIIFMLIFVAFLALSINYTKAFRVKNELVTMIEKFLGRPVGVDTIAAATGEDRLTIEDVYEPYLMQIGFVNRTPRGRVATKKAYEHYGFKFSGD